MAEYDWNWAEAEREFKRSIELNPNVALTHYQYGVACLTPLGRFDEAANEIKRALELEPLSVPASANLASVYVFARKNDLAVEQGREALRLEPNHPTARWCQAFAYNASGMYAEIYRPAVIHALLGDKEKAFAGLEKSFAAHDWDITRINVDPFVDSLRDDPRFKDLIKRMGFQQ